MPTITVALGAVLMFLGVAGNFSLGAVSLTALIPAAFGLAIAIAGLMARDEGKRRHAMHAAVAVALLGFLGSLRGVIPSWMAPPAAPPPSFRRPSWRR